MAFSGPNVMSSGAKKDQEGGESCAVEQTQKESNRDVAGLKEMNLKNKDSRISVILLVYIASIVIISTVIMNFYTLDKLGFRPNLLVYLVVLRSIAMID